MSVIKTKSQIKIIVQQPKYKLKSKYKLKPKYKLKHKHKNIKKKKKTTLALVDSITYKVISSKQKNNKEIIVELFNKNVRGKKYNKVITNNHCGTEGHWLEKQMGIKPNSNNEPDKLGYEQKKDSGKITFGDWSALEYIFKKNNKYNLTKDNFLKTFGSPNPKKNNRYSWSGKVFPKYGVKYNYAGQRMIFLENDDLVIQYSYLNDTREEKTSYMEDFKINVPIVLARWNKYKLENHILSKFGVKGFYICKKNKENIYDKICFGKVIDFQFFKIGLENNKIILDSGMYQGNSRNYSQFRANKSLWYDLLTEEY